MSEHRQSQIFCACAKFHSDDSLGDQLGCLRAEHMHAENLVGLSVGNTFDHAFGIVRRNCATTRAKGKGSSRDGFALRRQFLFGPSHPCDLRVGINHIRNGFVVNQRFEACDSLSNHDTFFRSLMGKHRASHNVAHCKYARNTRLTKIVNVQKATLIYGDTTIRRKKTFRTGSSPNGYDQLIHRNTLVTSVVLIGDINATVCFSGCDNPRTQTNIETLLS